MSFTLCISIPFISPSPHIYPLPLQPSPQNKTKLKGKIENLISWKLPCDTVSRAVNPFSVCLYLQVFMQSHWSDLRPLNAGPLQRLFLVILLLLCCGDHNVKGSAGHGRGRCWHGPSHNPGSGPRHLRVVSLPVASSPLSSPPG